MHGDDATALQPASPSANSSNSLVIGLNIADETIHFQPAEPTRVHQAQPREVQQFPREPRMETVIDMASDYHLLT